MNLPGHTLNLEVSSGLDSESKTRADLVAEVIDESPFFVPVVLEEVVWVTLVVLVEVLATPRDVWLF